MELPLPMNNSDHTFMIHSYDAPTMIDQLTRQRAIADVHMNNKYFNDIIVTSFWSVGLGTFYYHRSKKKK